MKGISHSSNQPRWAIIAIELQCLANCNFANCRACHNVTSPRCIVFISKALLILAKHRSTQAYLKSPVNTRVSHFFLLPVSHSKTILPTICQPSGQADADAITAFRAVLPLIVAISAGNAALNHVPLAPAICRGRQARIRSISCNEGIEPSLS